MALLMSGSVHARQVESGETPLQEKLGVLATAIGKFGLVIAVICFFVLLIR